MAKALSILGLVIAILIFCLFALDVAIGAPFEKASPALDIGFIICGLVLGYLSWSAYKEQV